jgi:hypothetical protein
MWYGLKRWELCDFVSGFRLKGEVLIVDDGKNGNYCWLGYRQGLQAGECDGHEEGSTVEASALALSAFA